MVLFSHSLDNGFFWNFSKNTATKNEKPSDFFLTCFVVTENIKICFLPAALVKNQQINPYHTEFICKRDITLAEPLRKIGFSLEYKYLS